MVEETKQSYTATLRKEKQTARDEAVRAAQKQRARLERQRQQALGQRRKARRVARRKGDIPRYGRGYLGKVKIEQRKSGEEIEAEIAEQEKAIREQQKDAIEYTQKWYDEALEKYKKDYAELDTGEWVYKKWYNWDKLSDEYKDALRKLGSEEYSNWVSLKMGRLPRTYKAIAPRHDLTPEGYIKWLHQNSQIKPYAGKTIDIKYKDPQVWWNRYKVENKKYYDENDKALKLNDYFNILIKEYKEK